MKLIKSKIGILLKSTFKELLTFSVKIPYFYIDMKKLLQKDSSSSGSTNLEDVDIENITEDDLDEARNLTAKYVQRSPTVPIKVHPYIQHFHKSSKSLS